MVLRSGEMMERKNKLCFRHDSQVGLETALEANARFGFSARGDFLDLRQLAEPRHHGLRLRRCHDKIQISHRLHATTGTPRRLRSHHLRQFTQPGHDRLPHLLGQPPKMAFAVGLAVTNPLGDFLLRLSAKSRQFRYLAVRTGLRETFDRIDAQLAVDRFDFFSTQSGDFEHLDQSGCNGRPQLLQKLQFPRRMQFTNFLSQSHPDTLH